MEPKCSQVSSASRLNSNCTGLKKKSSLRKFSCTLPSILTPTSTHLCLQYMWDPQKEGGSYIYSWKSCVGCCCLARDLPLLAHSLPLCRGSIIHCWRVIGTVVSTSAASEDSSWICNISNCWPHLCWARAPCWGVESCWLPCPPMFSVRTLASVHCMVPGQLRMQTEEKVMAPKSLP